MTNRISTLALAATLAAATAATLLPGSADAALTILANGSQFAGSGSNTFASGTGPIDGFNINTLTLAGIDAFGGSGEVMDVGALDISTRGEGSITLTFFQSEVMLAGGVQSLQIDYSALLSNATVTRSFWLNDLRVGHGGTQTLLGQVTDARGSFNSAPVDATGPFSLLEFITVTAKGPGAKLSADDSVRTVPEPAMFGLFGLGLLGLRTRRRTAA